MYLYMHMFMHVHVYVWMYLYITYIYMWECLKLRCPFFPLKEPFWNQKRTPHFETYPCVFYPFPLEPDSLTAA